MGEPYTMEGVAERRRGDKQVRHADTLSCNRVLGRLRDRFRRDVLVVVPLSGGGRHEL